MNVRAKLYAHLRDLAGTSELDLDLDETATVSDLLEHLYRSVPKLRTQDQNILVGAGLEFVGRNYRLKADEEVAIMPPVQGG